MNYSPLSPADAAASAALAADLLERFGRYVAVDTQSDPHSGTAPSSPGQWNLARLLVAELEALGLAEVRLSEHCYVTARLPSNLGAGRRAPTIGWLAHLDTSPDCSGKDVKLMVHRNWAGGRVERPQGPELSEATCPALAAERGRTILTSDGSTLLGADDKAGVSEIMAALRWLVSHPELSHGDIEVIFTPDEEIGAGIDHLPEGLASEVCYTVDGDEEGSYNAQCFTGWSIEVDFAGRIIHPGSARGVLVNAVAMAGMYIASLPRNESPEATDGAYGFYCPQEVRGDMEKSQFSLFIRDFDRGEIDRRLAYLRALAAVVEGAFPGGTVTVTAREQYRNMREAISARPETAARLERAIADTGITPQAKDIRGGTDGAHLSAKGIPTPNLFTGGHLYHSRTEWVALEAMARSSMTLVNLAQLWAG